MMRAVGFYVVQRRRGHGRIVHCLREKVASRPLLGRQVPSISCATLSFFYTASPSALLNGKPSVERVLSSMTSGNWSAIAGGLCGGKLGRSLLPAGTSGRISRDVFHTHANIEVLGPLAPVLMVLEATHITLPSGMAFIYGLLPVCHRGIGDVADGPRQPAS